MHRDKFTSAEAADIADLPSHHRGFTSPFSSIAKLIRPITHEYCRYGMQYKVRLGLPCPSVLDFAGSNRPMCRVHGTKSLMRREFHSGWLEVCFRKRQGVYGPKLMLPGRSCWLPQCTGKISCQIATHGNGSVTGEPVLDSVLSWTLITHSCRCLTINEDKNKNTFTSSRPKRCAHRSAIGYIGGQSRWQSWVNYSPATGTRCTSAS